MVTSKPAATGRVRLPVLLMAANEKSRKNLYAAFLEDRITRPGSRSDLDLHLLEEECRSFASHNTPTTHGLILDTGRDGDQAECQRNIAAAAILGIRNIAVAIDPACRTGSIEKNFEQRSCKWHKVFALHRFEIAKTIPLSSDMRNGIYHHQGELSWYRGMSLAEFFTLSDRAAG